MNSKQSIAAILLMLHGALALACTPFHYNTNEDRINAAWKGSDAIFIATVVKVEKFTVLDDHLLGQDGRPIKFEIPMERVEFRVDRVFKGKLKSGDIHVTETNLSPGSCGKSVVNDPVWLEPAIGETFDVEMFKQWLIYSWRGTAHSLSSSSRPLSRLLSTEDIKLLEKLSSKRTARRH